MIDHHFTMVNIAILLSSLTVVVSASDPVVTLNHKGQLRGKTATFNSTRVDLFLGVRYAKPPVDDMRFKKPEQVDGWSGVKDAKSVGNVCPQVFGTNVVGDEDCLFLDITVPGGVDLSAKKPVMLWIHGGGFVAGTGITYLGAPLAVQGDVIVVTINYRLNILGFLADGNGTGNFGLWDQRAAIVWVKENIAAFGGDADMITIFGGSAGAAGVTAQMLGRGSEGLFKRAILQSGSLFNTGAWYLSERKRYEIVSDIRKRLGCKMDLIYNCFDGMATSEVMKLSSLNADFDILLWRPVPDNDFFPADIEVTENYNLTQTFDMMAGFNGQEGGLSIAFTFKRYADLVGEPIDNGVSMEWVNKFMVYACEHRFTPLSTYMCARSLKEIYELDKATDDKDRLIRLSYMFGDESINADMGAALVTHSLGYMSTYAYYFEELRFRNKTYEAWSYPDWAKKSADHAAEVAYVWGHPILRYDDDIVQEYVETSRVQEFPSVFRYLATDDKDVSLSLAMMTMWTNFAKSGNPTQPGYIKNLPDWPKFSLPEEYFMSLKSNEYKVKPFPNGDKIVALFTEILSARKQQVLIDRKPMDSSDERECTKTSGTTPRLVTSIVILVVSEVAALVA